MKSVNHFCKRLIELGEKDNHPNPQGNTVHRFFLSAERYLIDFATNFRAEGWQQYDTDQDAHYFGVWFNHKSLRVLSYAEGDWTLVSCLDAEHFNAEIEALNEFHLDGFAFKTIDTETGQVTTYVQNRSEFLIGGGE